MANRALTDTPSIAWNFATAGQAKANIPANVFLNVLDYGVTGNGSTDDTAALQAAIDAAPNYSTLYIPTGLNIRTTDSIVINNRKGLRLTSGGEVGASGSNPGATKITYDGANDGTVIVMDGTRDSILENFTITCNDKAKVGIDVKMTIAATEATSFNRYKSLTIWQSASGRTNWRGIQIAENDTGQNCEHFVIEECFFSGGAVSGSDGVHINSAGNALVHAIINCAFDSCAIGVFCYLGSFYSTNSMMNNNHYDFWTWAIDPCFIDFTRTENAYQFIGTGSGNAPLHLRGNNFGSPNAVHATSWIDYSGSALVMTANQFNIATFADIPPFAPSGSHLVSIGNVYAHPDILTYFRDTFVFGVVSLGDSGVGATGTAASLNRSFFSSGDYRTYGDVSLHEQHATGQVLMNGDFFGALDNDASIRALIGLTDTGQIKFGDPACALRLRTSLATISGTPVNGDCWIDFTGTTPSRQLRLNVRDGGVTYSVNIGAAH